MMNYNYVVLIQIYDEADLLASCLESLAKQTEKPSSVIIVDDGTPNDSILDEYVNIMIDGYLSDIPIEYCRAAESKKPNLDTVGKAIFYAWEKYSMLSNYNYVSIIDVDSQPEPDYYKELIIAMEKDSDLICTSGDIVVGGKTEKFISAKVIKRNYAQGSGKVIRQDFLAKIPFYLFPEVAWDTWINTKAKLAGKKAVQIPGINLYCSRPTTRLAKMDKFRDGRLTYHFGYNPLLLLYKILFRGIDVWKGYSDARKKKWRLPDEEVRKWFGWRYLIHFWK